MAEEPGAVASYAVLKIGEIDRFSTSSASSVALLCHVSNEAAELQKLTAELLRLRCRHISIYGTQSSDVEDTIDTFLEDTEHGLDVVTASHENEPIDEVVNLVFSVLPPKSCAIAIFENKRRSLQIIAEFERVGREVTRP